MRSGEGISLSFERAVAMDGMGVEYTQAIKQIFKWILFSNCEIFLGNTKSKKTFQQTFKFTSYFIYNWKQIINTFHK